MKLRIALSGLVVGSCVWLSASPAQQVLSVQGERLIEDPWLHRLVYHWTEDCVGKTGTVDGLEWRTAGAIFNQTEKHFVWGIYFFDLNGKRVIMLARDKLYDYPTIIHESLHDILRLTDGEPEFEAARAKCEGG